MAAPPLFNQDIEVLCLGDRTLGSLSEITGKFLDGVRKIPADCFITRVNTI